MARLEGTRLILAVRSLRTATDFYVNALGFKRDFGDESDGWSWLSRDNFRVGLGECKDAMPANELGDHSYVAYVNVDGAIDMPFVRQHLAHLGDDDLLSPAAIADTFWYLAHQDRRAWTHELDLRPFKETF